MNVIPTYVYLTLCVLFWAGNAIVGKMASGHIPAFTLSFWRWIIAFVIILPFGFRAVIREWHFFRSNWKFLCVIAFLSVTIYNTFQYWALNWTSAINVGIVSACLPFLILLLTAIAGHEKINRFQWGGTALAFLGVIYVISRADIDVLVNFRVNLGDGLILIAVIGWAIYSVLLKRVPAHINQLGLLTVLIFLGIFGIIPFYAWDVIQGKTFALTFANALILVYVSVFASVLAYVFWNHAVNVGGANLAGIFVNLIPGFIALMAVLFLGERLETFHIIGIGLIFIGIYIATISARHRKAPTAKSGV